MAEGNVEYEELDEFPKSRAGGRQGYKLSPLELQILEHIQRQERSGLVFYYALVNEFRHRTHSTKRIARCLRSLHEHGYISASHTNWMGNPIIQTTREEESNGNQE